MRPAITSRTPLLPRLLVALLATSVALPTPVRAQQPSPGSREAMWPAPTEEDWARPCLITFQRTWEDAQRVAAETGKPLLVCINMDGEIASEHYAGIRYRQPEIARLYEPYVCVIASTYRHTDRDHDDQGRRIPCPRFGSVTCGEHIAIEPGLHEQFMEGQRVAPRHIGVDPDSGEMYDVYYAWDTDSVFQAIVDGVEDWPASPPVQRGDRAPEELVASADVIDREAVEQAYLSGTRELRRRLLEAAAARGPDAPVELLRLASAGQDLELARMARVALAGSHQPAAVTLIAETLRQPLAAAERSALIEALERLASSSPRAATLARVHRGLDESSSVVDLAGWAAALGPGDGRPTLRVADSEALERQDELLEQGSASELLDLADNFLAHAYETWDDDQDYAKLVFMDARDTALQAEQRGAYGWRPHGVVAVASHYLGDAEEALARAEAAVRSGLPMDAPGWDAMAVVALFAGARQEAIQQAVRDKQPWPSEWLTDVHAACNVLARHPHGTVEQILTYHDFLLWLGAAGQAGRVLDVALERFPSAWDVHDRLRGRLLRERGADDLEPHYDGLLAAAGDDVGDLAFFAGHASLVTAEFHRRMGRPTAAREAYQRAIAHWERDIAAQPERRDEADAAVARALGGLARLSFEAGDDSGALDELLASFTRHPASAADLDGLNLSTVDTAKMLMARLLRLERDDDADRLQAALDDLDPALLRLPAYEARGPASQGRRQGRGQAQTGDGGRRGGRRPRDG